MGAPKQKWTSEEESALKAGVVKHGAGKWRTILKDPEFSSVLYLRSNVDLKDKWRNMSVMSNGYGSREKGRLALRRVQHGTKDDNPLALATVDDSDEYESGDRPLPSSSVSPQIGASKRSMIRLDNLIVEAINNLKEPGGSNRTTIATYIEEQYWAPPNFKRLLSMKLKYLAQTGKLVKTKRKYRIASANAAMSDKKKLPAMLRLEGRQTSGSPMRVDKKDEIIVPTKGQIDLELQKMRNMTPQEAAAAAAQAVAEAEAAIAEAEEAAREAEAAEADAEAAQAFAEAALKTLKGRNTQRLMIRA
ncbi:telomere repeat-binding factor 1-like [Rutidosis leptorrhynchoides]|uniref:telomere repeat-binding factor 1-like n=1 Tax=Rutidosis leptorrhynchoides TaxID=125765 RepID=UPI003A99332C